MPRAFSSGALSIWSKADASLRFGYLSCSTLVIAAVSVVLPWSMCPMVPMLTCGLVRSNLALATEAPSGVAARSRGVLCFFPLFGLYRFGPELVYGRGCGRQSGQACGHSPRAFWMI